MKKYIIFLILFFTLFTTVAQKTASTKTLLNAAFSKAIGENKNVFVIFKASWCGWCKKLDASLKDTSIKKYFDSSYVFVYLTVQESKANKKLENEGADVILNGYGGKDAGLPYFVIFDNYGTEIGRSVIDNENIGCPSTAKEVEAFTKLVKKSSQINDAGIDKITTRFRQNELPK
jgi:thioredoxin-related protein